MSRAGAAQSDVCRNELPALILDFHKVSYYFFFSLLFLLDENQKLWVGCPLWVWEWCLLLTDKEDSNTDCLQRERKAGEFSAVQSSAIHICETSPAACVL